MPRRLLVVLLGLCVVAAVAALRAADPGPLQVARLKSFDLYQQLAPRPYRDAAVRVVDIDAAALARFGQWPWPRTLLARLVERLERAGVAVIAFDMVFSEPDRTSPRQMTALWRQWGELEGLEGLVARLPDHDAVFAEALAAAPTVGGVLATRGASGAGQAAAGQAAAGTPAETLPPRKAGFAHGGSDPAPVLQRFDGLVRNLPAVEQAVTGLGLLSLSPDRDNVIRRVPLLVALDGEVYPALAVEALRVAFGASTLISRSVDASGQVGAGQSGLSALKIGPLDVPLTRTGELWVRYAVPAPQRVVSAAWALDSSRAALAERLEGTIVLIGTSAPGLRDLRATPLRAAEPGVLVQAQMIEQMLLGTHLARPDWARGAELLGLAAAGLLVAAAAPLLGALWGALLGLGLLAALAGASWLAFAEARLLLDPVAPALAVVAAYLCVTTAQYLLSERERSRIRGAFGQYLAPALVERLAREPGRLRLGGETRELTLLFVDLRGFTGLSERLSAAEVTRFLNAFLTPMTEAVMAAGGTVDKYMGDALMAFWNAPLDQPDHAARACRAALDMRARFAALRRELDAPDLGIGIGLNSGPANVGNMGSAQRFDYSAIGDTVNLASRLESLSKTYGLDIVAGQSLPAAAPGFAWLELDRVRVVGKQAPVRIYTLLDAAADAPGAADLIARQAAALAAYRAGDWDAARSAFAAAATLAPDWLAPLYRLYQARLAALERDPPGPDWDGVFVAREK